MIRRCVAVVDGCETDSDFIVTLGGVPAERLLAEGLPQDQTYWLRVWALRGLLWASPGNRVEVLGRTLADDHWRVREMACKVVARHRVDEVLDAVVDLQSDTVVRVRRAAERTLRRIPG
ncbi:MAG TPA: HEAT repeat domain-containing protein [Acidimicrobiales bacterium]|nr:HEAT repeat domain-containing protein [Acidimicrobiales bacterium]